MRLRQWGAGAVLTLALISSVVTIILYRISMLGVTKVFGHFSGGTGIALLFLFGVVALVNLLTIPLTLLLGVGLLITSAKKNPSGALCAVFTCLVSISNLLF